MKRIKIKRRNIIKILTILFICYAVIHVACFFIYKPSIDFKDYNNIIKGLKFTKTINISSEKTDDYLSFHTMKIKNDFNGFEKQEDKLRNYDKYFNHDAQTGFIIGMDETHVTLLQNNESFYSEMSDYRVNNKNITKYLEKNNIKDDLDLIRHVQKNKIDSYNIFTSIFNMKDKFLLSYIISLSLPTPKEIYKIVGDHGGYAFVLDNIIEVSILENDKRYIYSFIGRDYFTDEYVNELLNSIVIE